MSIKKRLVAVAATVAMALGIVVIAETPAAASFSQCPAGTACIFTDAYGGGYALIITFTDFGHAGCVRLDQGSHWGFDNTRYNNSVSSMIADYGSGHALQLSYGTTCSAGDFPALYKGEQWPYLYWPDNDSFSSFKII